MVGGPPPGRKPMEQAAPEKEYRLLAVDVDGTLLYGGSVDEADLDALRRAAKAGKIVCLCTGRSWNEVQPIWDEMKLPAPHAPVVCVGGALVVEPDTGRSLYSRAFDRATADELAQEMHRMGYPVMALVDAWREGFDYHVIGRHEDCPLYRRFFDQRQCRIRRAEGLNRPDCARPLRISLLEEADRATELVEILRRRFAGRIEIQAIHLHSLDLYIVEAFAAGANKLTAMVYVGQGYRIGRGAMAAIGDDYNDLPLLVGAALSATTADAPEQLRRAAGVIVAARGQRGVAEFVEMVLAGRRAGGAG